MKAEMKISQMKAEITAAEIAEEMMQSSSTMKAEVVPKGGLDGMSFVSDGIPVLPLDLPLETVQAPGASWDTDAGGAPIEVDSWGD